MPRSEALIRAQRKYDKERPSVVALRIPLHQQQLIAQRLSKDGESVAQTVKRVVLELISD